MKNGMGVGVPVTGMVGLAIDAAVGAIGGDPTAGLEVLANITPVHVTQAEQMIDFGRVSVEIKDVPNALYTEVLISVGTDSALVIIKDHHTQVVLKALNGNPVFEASTDTGATTENARPVVLSVASIYEFAIGAPFEKNPLYS